jgi:Protein of unknown function (DUF3352)
MAAAAGLFAAWDLATARRAKLHAALQRADLKAGLQPAAHAVGRAAYDRVRARSRRCDHGPPKPESHVPSPSSPIRAAAARPFARALSMLATCAAAALALGACGSSGGGGTAADPATAVPASAPLFVGADVRPSGAEKSGALAAGSQLTHQADPYKRLLAVLQTPGSPALSFGSDVAPWLGPHAGIFLSSLRSAGSLTTLLQRGLLGQGALTQSAFPFGAGGAQGALVLDTSDAGRARGFLDRQASRAGAHRTSYRGVALQVGSGDVAFALVHRLAVIGSEAGVRAAIDASAGGSSLAASSGYAKLLRAAPPGALAHIYSNPSAAGGAASGAASGASGAGAASSGGQAGLLGLLSGAREANVSLLARSGSLSLDADTLASGGAPGGLLSTDPEGVAALGELPGDSWLAIGVGHVGASLAADVQGLSALAALGGGGSSEEAEGGASSLGAAGLNVKSLLQAMLTPVKVIGGSSAQARRDFSSWMGSAGIFASGGSLLELKAAIVIASKDAARSRAAVGKLVSRLRAMGGSPRPAHIAGTEAASGIALMGLPVVLEVAAGRDAAGHAKFALGFGEASIADALRPQTTMSGAASRTAAAAALGEGIQPSLMLDFPTVLTLLESVGLTSDPSLAPALPYLRAATALSGGAHDLGGGVQRFRLVLGLQGAGG